MINKAAAETVLGCLFNQGVRVFCVCPGGRAAPFVEALSSPAAWAGAAAKELEVLYFFEERSAGFFALGRAERDRRPTAVVTTSGTALAELLPSVIEGFYSGLPLVLLTADRPAEQRAAGAPQTIQNPLSLFRLYSAASIDISAGAAARKGEAPCSANQSTPPARGLLNPPDPPCFQGENPPDPPCFQGENPTDPPCFQGENPPDPPCFQGENPPDPPCFQGENPPDPPCFQGGRRLSEKPDLLNKLSALRHLDDRRSILHINMSFDEPLYSSSPAVATPRAKNAPPSGSAMFSASKAGAQNATKPAEKEAEALLLDPLFLPEERGACPANRGRSLNRAVFQSDRRAFTRLCKKPLIIVGGLKEPEAFFAKPLLENYKGAFYAEPLSSLGFLANRLRAGERTASSAFAKGFADGIIRIGGVPRARFWRDMERLRPPVFHLSSPPDFAGLSYKDRSFQHPLTRESLEALLSSCGQEQAALKAARALKIFDEKQTKKQRALLSRFPESEPAWARRLHEILEEGAQIFLGNSLPIRLWDMITLESDKKFSVKGQGGVNGIDGLISRFFGGLQSAGGAPAAALIGDLSALYDMAGLWAAPKKNRSWKVFVMNNRGGRLFSRFSSDKRFLNEHSLSFRPLAKMFGLPYRLCSGRPQDCSWDGLKTAQFIEIRPNLKETERFFQAYDKLSVKPV